ncbi:aspartyl/asparaginyl beta-hydroxylase domain-containing protein [Actinacidiphila rubida]|nr:aspartyl/asparaginyl beta-hydroxylase domain-containing protein [Actinacidiphila rubida]
MGSGTVSEQVLTGLAGQVARLGDIEPAVLDAVRAEAVLADRGVVAYGDYQSGGWWTASLLNHSGDHSDTVIGDGRPRPTGLLEQMPATGAFLESLGLDFMYVRLARLEANSYLWEHRDYAELREIGRHRLHIPLVTNPSSVLVTAGAQVHLAAGALWRLTPTVAHGVRNVTGPDRLHLIADVYTDDAYDQLATHTRLAPGDVRLLPELEPAGRQQLLVHARSMADLGFKRAAEHHLLHAYFDYALPEGGAYELVAEMYARRGNRDRAAWWTNTATHLLARETAPARRPQ